MHRHLSTLAAVGAAALALPAAAGAARPSCPGPVPAKTARCLALAATNARGKVVANVTPAGYRPADLQAAYRLPSASAGSGQTIAIVDAYDDPSANADLKVYRSQFGLPACTAGNGCFRKVNQNGGTTLPARNGGWAQEISLDLDMASAICPNCRILLVEASSASMANLATAEDTAARLGATVISNSYGGSEFSGETATDSHYHHPGIPITVSSGDSGYGVEYPAASPFVTAVGGTTLTRASATARGFTEKAWSGAGSGCSAFEPKPVFQTDAGCARRTVADVSAVANPNTGVAVYDSFAYQGASGWLVFGGTSVSAPLVAGVYALAGNGASIADAGHAYANAGSLFDVLSGANGTCSPAYLCKARTGFDGPTGLGTPNGLGAF